MNITEVEQLEVDYHTLKKEYEYVKDERNKASLRLWIINRAYSLSDCHLETLAALLRSWDK